MLLIESQKRSKSKMIKIKNNRNRKGSKSKKIEIEKDRNRKGSKSKLIDCVIDQFLIKIV